VSIDEQTKPKKKNLSESIINKIRTVTRRQCGACGLAEGRDAATT